MRSGARSVLALSTSQACGEESVMGVPCLERGGPPSRAIRRLGRDIRFQAYSVERRARAPRRARRDAHRMRPRLPSGCARRACGRRARGACARVAGETDRLVRRCRRWTGRWRGAGGRCARSAVSDGGQCGRPGRAAGAAGVPGLIMWSTARSRSVNMLACSRSRASWTTWSRPVAEPEDHAVGHPDATCSRSRSTGIAGSGGRCRAVRGAVADLGVERTVAGRCRTATTMLDDAARVESASVHRRWQSLGIKPRRRA